MPTLYDWLVSLQIHGVASSNADKVLKTLFRKNTRLGHHRTLINDNFRGKVDIIDIIASEQYLEDFINFITQHSHIHFLFTTLADCHRKRNKENKLC